MRKTAAIAAIALLTATLGVGLASPASGGGTTITVDPMSGPVGTTVSVEGFCGFIPGNYEIAFLGPGRFSYTAVGGESPPADAGPYEYEFQIPAVLESGPDAPRDVVPGTYEFGIQCENFETEAYVEFEVTPSAPTTTEATTTTTGPTTTVAPAAEAVRLQPAFTG